MACPTFLGKFIRTSRLKVSYIWTCFGRAWFFKSKGSVFLLHSASSIENGLPLIWARPRFCDASISLPNREETEMSSWIKFENKKLIRIKKGCLLSSQKSGWQDLNLRHHVPKTCALPLRYTPFESIIYILNQ